MGSLNMRNTIPLIRSLSFGLIKPDLYESALTTKDITHKIMLNRFRIVLQKRVKFTIKTAQEFYAPLSEKYYYERAVAYLSSGHMVAMILAKVHAVVELKDLVKGTDKKQGLRSIYGRDETRNGIHASDSTTEAYREIKLVFPDFNIPEWIEKERSKLYK